MADSEPPAAPSSLWRATSAAIVGLTGTISRSFLLGANRLETHGLEGFLKLLDDRRDVDGRQRGLITASNHLSVLDDPLMWGSLPFRYFWSPNDNRWALGSHDIAFKNKSLATFFSLGQTLPAHRLAHSPHGGLFQPTMTQVIRILSRRPFLTRPTAPDSPAKTISPSPDASRSPAIPLTDPFTAAELTYSTNGQDVVPAPSAYLSRRHGWVHVFPEGRIHQHAEKTMRYFKWGVSRMILESEPCPDFVPIWIEGFDQIMHEDRTWPRPVPRVGRNISVTFGQKVDVDVVFGDLRQRWRAMVEQERKSGRDNKQYGLGECPDSLQTREDAVRLREECTMRIRDEVLKLRVQRGWGTEDPKARLVDTWREEGRDRHKREGKMKDGSFVKEG